MPELIEPSAWLHSAWLEAHAEWGRGVHDDGFGIGPSDDVESHDGFAAWLVPGGIALRDGDDDYTKWAGHIGYGIRPSERRRGLATRAVSQILGQTRALGMNQVLAACALDNTASIATIKRSGGVFDGIRDTTFGPVRRY